MKPPEFSAAAQANIDETSADIDLRDLRDGEHTRETLLAMCLEGADPDRVQGWRDYVDALCATIPPLDWTGFGNARRYDTEEGELPRMYRHLDNAKDGRFLVHDYLGGSDYSGSLVNVANAQAWEEEFAEGKDVWWARVYGSHGTFAIVVDTVTAPVKAHATLCALEDYPCIDDELHSRLESEAYDEAWRDTFREDFLKLIETTHRIEFTDREELEDAKVRAVFEAARERANEYWVNEEGSGVWVPVGRVIKALTADEILELAKSAPSDIAF